MRRTKKSVLHAGNITTGATYTPLLLVGFVFTYSAYYGNANGDVWVVAQQTLSFIKPLALQHILDQINANQLFCRKYIYFENHLPQNATQQIFAGMIFALCSSDNPKKNEQHTKPIERAINKRKKSENLESIKRHASIVKLYNYFYTRNIFPIEEPNKQSRGVKRFL